MKPNLLSNNMDEITITTEDFNKFKHMVQEEHERIGLNKAIEALKSDDAIKFQIDNHNSGRVLWTYDMAKWLENMSEEILNGKEI